MMISTRGRYALFLMLDIAKNQKDGYVPLKDSALRQEISKKYLERIVIIPGISALLTANRGKGGGYRLARGPSEITVGMILRAAEGTLCPVSCVGENKACENGTLCPLLPVWNGLDRVVSEYLDGISLQDILDGCGGHHKQSAENNT